MLARISANLEALVSGEQQSISDHSAVRKRSGGGKSTTIPMKELSNDAAKFVWMSAFGLSEG